MENVNKNAEIENNTAMVSMSPDEYKEYMQWKQAQAAQNAAMPMMTPVNPGNANGMGFGMPMPPFMQPPKKESGWSTIGKVLLGAGGMAIIWGITSALGGGGDDNIFHGDMPR